MGIAFIYLATGLLFTYLAIQSIENTIWEGSTIVLLIVATLSFGASIRYMWHYFRSKNKKR